MPLRASLIALMAVVGLAIVGIIVASSLGRNLAPVSSIIGAAGLDHGRSDPLRPPAATQVGVNVASVVWYSNERAFSNLILGGYWQFAGSGGWSNLEAPHIGADDSLLSVPVGGSAVRMLTMPATPSNGSIIRCLYSGKGDVTVRGNATEVVSRPGLVKFRWVNLWQNNVVWLQVQRVDAKAPISRIDCREVAAEPTARFNPSFISSLKGYKVLRFMGWQRTNENAVARWADRHTPTSLDVISGTGVAVEDIVDLAKQVDTDVWVTSPWNADDDYIEHFARLLHDGLPRSHSIYVEVGNEVWNTGFPVARQALAEGQRRALGSNPREAQMRRYAERTIETMRIWERVFADDPARLVRVVSTQHVVPEGAEIVLGYPGLADHVDALATAPYFGQDLQAAEATRDLDKIFHAVGTSIGQSYRFAEANRAVAGRYRKRYLAYEAGQHIVLPADVSLLASIQRDPRMYSVYRAYLETWRAQVGDTIMLFASTGSIGPGGAWGLAEHSGQSPKEAPKLRAVLDALAK